MSFLSPKQRYDNQANRLKNLSIRQNVLYGTKLAPKQEQVAAAKAILLGDEIIKYWKIHAVIMAILYTIWILCGIQSGDVEFVFTTSDYKDLWVKILCTQALVWIHTCNVASTILVWFILRKRSTEVGSGGSISCAIEKCKRSLLLVLFCSLTFYSIMSCYREHSDAATLNMCPIILFVAFSHISSVLFKVEFYKHMKRLRYTLRDPEAIATDYVGEVKENLASLERE